MDPLTSLPPLDKYNIIASWIATLFYGMNILLYAGAMYILGRKHLKERITQWPLMTTCSLTIILATLHIAAVLTDLLNGFVDGARSGTPGATVLYWVSFQTVPMGIKSFVYLFMDTTQELVLVWRLYMVWGCNRRIIIAPLLVAMAHFSTSFYVAYSSIKFDNTLSFQVRMTLACWILTLIVYLGCTFAIAGRLWYFARRTMGVRGTTHTSDKYSLALHAVIETGFLFTISLLVPFVMTVKESPMFPATVNAYTQLAAFTSLLIIVRIGIFNSNTSISNTERWSTAKRSQIDDSKSNHPIGLISITRTVETDGSETLAQPGKSDFHLNAVPSDAKGVIGSQSFRNSFE